MLHNDSQIQAELESFLEILKKLPASINSIDKKYRRNQVENIQSMINQGLLAKFIEENLKQLNSELSTKNYQLSQDSQGNFMLLDRDIAHEISYSERFKYYTDNSSDKSKCVQALTQFTDELCQLDFISNLISEGVTVLDIGAGNGYVGTQVAKILNKAGKAHYVGVERTTQFVYNIENHLKTEKIPFTIYAQDFRKILELLSTKSTNIALASHLYTTTPMIEFLPMVFNILNENGVLILVHDTTKADAVKFRSLFGNLCRLGGQDNTIEIDNAFNQSGLDSITTTYTSSLIFPNLSEHDWQSLKKIKQADYDNQYPDFSPELHAAKNLIDFVISDKLEAFNEVERNQILDQMKDFLSKHNNQFESTCKIQVALSPKHTNEFKKQFLQLKEKIENPAVKLEETSSTQYFRIYNDDQGFRAEIIMNLRDAMTFGDIQSLPESEERIEASVKQFVDIFTKQYGGKAVITVAEELLGKLPESLLKPGEFDGRYITTGAAEISLQRVCEKKHVANQLEKFKTNEFKFLTREDLKTRTAELSEFKIKYASFIDETKIKRGQYSKKAEDEKLNNPYVEHYAIEHNGSLIACVMHVMHGNGRYTYDADFIVHPDYRSNDVANPQGVGQALCVKAAEHMKNTYPHITGTWLIAGGYGKLGVGNHLYAEIFPTESLKENLSMQKKLGFFLMFGSPGLEFLAAANRDPKTSLVINEEKDVALALSILEQSKEPELAAKQPVSLELPKVVPMSMFTPQDKSPKENDPSYTPSKSPSFSVPNNP